MSKLLLINKSASIHVYIKVVISKNKVKYCSVKNFHLDLTKLLRSGLRIMKRNEKK